MARTLEEIVRLDRRWFRAHPERRHRCRWPDTGELDLCDSARGARLVMAIRHLGRGRVVYQPVIFQGALPTDERSAAALFALAATSPEPIPVIAQMDLLRLRFGLRQQTQSQEASAIVATNRPQHPSGEVVLSCAAARHVRGKSGHSEVGGGLEGEGILIASLTALMAFGVIIGMSAQSAAEGLIKQQTGSHIASKRNDPGSDDEAGGQAGANGWDLARNEPRVGKAPAGTTSQVDRPAEMPNATSPREPVAAPVRGRVVFAAPFKSYGPLLIIAHGEYHTVLWGFAQLEVVVDDLVFEGQTLGLIGGQSGAASILHMERRRDGHPINLND